jgi:hypothetical protein
MDKLNQQFEPYLSEEWELFNGIWLLEVKPITGRKLQ